MNWISVKERLPELYVTVIFYDSYYELVEFGCLNDDGWPIFNKVVSHWMPLPDPPKREDEYVHVYHSFSGEQKVDCERKFSVTSHYCTPCKFYGDCVTKEFPVFS